ncbi:peptidyl-prolyl cis-trans isomerase [Nocardioides sp. Bht2]|uniref:peptidylprolyl isomerase n=1 Tax=Nocardioides sp. Bht2 TaxID=3392297 RepID=UPI0039B624D6
MDATKGRFGTGTIGLVIAVLAVIAGAVWFFGFRDAPLDDDVVVQYGDDVVKVDDFQDRSAALIAIHALQVPGDAGAQEVFRRQMAKSIAISEVLDAAAEKRGITVPEGAEQKTLDELLTRLKTTPEKFASYLDQSGATQEQVLVELRRQLIAQQLYQDVTAKIEPVDEDELRTAFDSASGHLATPEKRVVSSIVVKDKKSAQQVLAQLRGGASFEKLAKKRSIDTATAAQGGVLGEFAKKDLEEAYAELAFAAKAGALFGPVKTWSGWHVGRVDKVIAAKNPTFAEAKEGLRKQVEERRGVDLWEDWLGKQLKDADLRYGDDYRPASPNDPTGAVPTNAAV